MKATSINIQPVKGGSELHNTRAKKLDYVREDLSHLNESWSKTSIHNRLEQIKANYLASVGQQMQAKATPIREGVVVINKDTTMKQLQNFAQEAEEKFGIKAFQIHIHKDEGYLNAKKWKPNYHAHLVFDWTQENGKSCKLNRQNMSELQTMLSECLQMERGLSSDKKHLTAIQFKNKREEEYKIQLQKEVRNIQLKKSVKNTLYKASERLKDSFGISVSDREKEGLKAAYLELKSENDSLKMQRALMINSLQTEKERTEKLQENLKNTQTELLKSKKIIQTLSKELKELLAILVPNTAIIERIKTNLPFVYKFFEKSLKSTPVSKSKGLRR